MRELLTLATDVAREAGELVVRLRHTTDVGVAATKSSPTDVVTESDRAAEALIRERLSAARPKDAFLGEESGDSAGESGVRWYADPIDGTVNYLYAIPWYAVSIAAEVDGEMAIGAVHNPVSGETWTAVRGEGAWLDGTEVRVSAQGDLAQALVATGFHYDAERRGRQARGVAALLPRIRDIRRLGVASLDLCAVATGRVDGYVEEGLQPWDLAAGGLIAREAGAVVAGLQGAEAGERLVLAANPPLFGRLEHLATEVGL